MLASPSCYKELLSVILFERQRNFSVQKFTVSPDPRSAFEQPVHLSTPSSHVHTISGSSDGPSGEKAVHPSTFSYACSTDQMAVMDSGGGETNPFLTASSMMMSASQLARYTSMYPNEVYETLGDLMFPRALAGGSTAATSVSRTFGFHPLWN